MLGVRQRVHGRDARVRRELRHVRLGIGPDDRPMDHPAQHARGVLDGLPTAKPDGGIEEQRASAELMNPDLETHPRAGRGFREDHGPGLAHSGRGCPVRLPLKVVRLQDRSMSARESCSRLNRCFMTTAMTHPAVFIAGRKRSVDHKGAAGHERTSPLAGVSSGQGAGSAKYSWRTTARPSPTPSNAAPGASPSNRQSIGR